MKFIIIEKYGSRIVEAENIEEAVQMAYDTHTEYQDVMAVVKAEETPI